MPRIDINSKVMQCGASSKDALDEAAGSKPALILDDSHVFDASYRMLYPDPERGDFLIILFFFHSKFSASRLFYRLPNNNTIRLVSLISGILIQLAGVRKRIRCIGYFLVMRLAADTRTDKKNQTASRNDNRIFNRVLLFLSAVIFLLLLPIDWTRDFSLCPVVQQNRKSFVQRMLFEQLRKLFLSFCRHNIRITEALLKDAIQNMNKAVALFLIHIEYRCMIFLKRVILQVNQYEEQTSFNRREGTVFVDGKASSVVPKFTIHIINRQVLVMSFREIRKQAAELVRGKTRQRTEAFFVILIVCIIHDAKVRTRT